MAKKALPESEAATPAVVHLCCADLGQTRPFTPAHAKALLAYQEAKGIKNGWAPAEAAPASTDNA